MKTWLILCLIAGVSWLLTDVRADNAFQCVFAPLVFSVMVLTVLVKVLLKVGIFTGNGTCGSGGSGGFFGGGDGGCGGDGGGC